MAARHAPRATGTAVKEAARKAAVAPQESGRLIDSSSLELLAQAATSMGWAVEASGKTLRLRRGAVRRVIRWPFRPDPSKLAVPRLVEAARLIRGCPTRVLNLSSVEPLWLPGCIKPSRGTNGFGFEVFSDLRGWRQAIRNASRLNHVMVMQPLLSGTEFRITVTATGDFSVAELAAQRGSERLWVDRTDVVVSELVADICAVLQRLQAPVIGADIIWTGTAWFLLDVNLSPSLGLHLATDQPRDLAAAVVMSWPGVWKARRAGPTVAATP